MQQNRKTSKSTFIVAGVVVVVMVAIMIIWSQYESKHKAELKASVLTTDTSKLSTPPVLESEPEEATPKRVIPDDPEELLVMVEEAFEDEGYFEAQDTSKGMHVYFLLKKCLTCDGDPGKVEGMAKRLKELSDESYGPWHVDSSILTDLDGKIAAAKQM